MSMLHFKSASFSVFVFCCVALLQWFNILSSVVLLEICILKVYPFLFLFFASCVAMLQWLSILSSVVLFDAQI